MSDQSSKKKLSVFYIVSLPDTSRVSGNWKHKIMKKCIFW